MEQPIKNYEQNQKIGSDMQTIILDDQLTGETDEKDPLFDDDKKEDE